MGKDGRVRSAVRRLFVALLCLLPTACGPDATPPPQFSRTVDPAVVSSSATQTGAVLLSWGDAATREGVTVHLSEPVPLVTPQPRDLGQFVDRQVAWDVMVRNGSSGTVRVGFHARVGALEAPPVERTRPPEVPKGGIVMVRRTVLLPRLAPTAVVQVSALVDGLPVRHGWTYSGRVARP